MDDLLAPLLTTPTWQDAQRMATDLCAAGNTDALAEAIHHALTPALTLTTALPSDEAAADTRRRLLDLAVVVADDVSTTDLAATLWLDIARGRSRAMAFEAAARAFAYEPDRTETLELITDLARRENTSESDGSRSWLRRLAREGVLTRNAIERFEAALEPPEPRTPDDDLWHRMLQAADDQARSLVEELEKDGRLDAARQLVLARWESVHLRAPEGGRFYGVLEAMVAKVPPGRERGELLCLTARVGLSADGDTPSKLALLTRSIEDAPDFEPAYELLEEIFTESPEMADEFTIARVPTVIGRTIVEAKFDKHVPLGRFMINPQYLFAGVGRFECNVALFRRIRSNSQAKFVPSPEGAARRRRRDNRGEIAGQSHCSRQSEGEPA